MRPWLVGPAPLPWLSLWGTGLMHITRRTGLHRIGNTAPVGWLAGMDRSPRRGAYAGPACSCCDGLWRGWRPCMAEERPVAPPGRPAWPFNRGCTLREARGSAAGGQLSNHSCCQLPAQQCVRVLGAAPKVQISWPSSCSGCAAGCGPLRGVYGVVVVLGPRSCVLLLAMGVGLVDQPCHRQPCNSLPGIARSGAM